jgi:glutamate dehydrogenase
MRARCGELITELEDRPPLLPHAEVAEAIAFLKWMDDDHFTFLGYREYRFEGRGARAVSKIDPKSGLGLLRDPEIRVFKGLRNLGKLPAAMWPARGCSPASSPRWPMRAAHARSRSCVKRRPT